MDLYLIIALALLFIISSIILFIRRNNNNKVEIAVAPVINAIRPPPRMAGGRRRVVRIENVRRVDNADDSDNLEEEPAFDEELEALKQSGKVGTKKLKKLEEKAEKRAQREAMEQERAEKKERQDQLDRERQRKERQLHLEEEAKVESDKLLKEEKKKKEEEEYQALKLQFTVEEEGVDAVQDEEMQNLLEEFINNIKVNKVVVLEDLARQFKLKAQEVIDRIKYLQDDNQLTGILDDRGKFIYITNEEYKIVAEFIKKRGRVTITELANNMNNLIQLNPVTI